MCGIFGAIGTTDVRDTILSGIALLQHRGQEAAGILLINNKTDQHYLHKKNGGLSSLQPEQLAQMSGTLGAAHLRYATTGGDSDCNAQPFWTDEGNVGFVHNGQVENMANLLDLLVAKGKRTLSNSDGELLLRIFSSELRGDPDRIFIAVKSVQQMAKGGYSCILPIKDIGLLAFRDPHGIRPLVLGRRKDECGVSVAFSSESVALELNGFTDIEDVKPGEAVLVRNDLTIERHILEQKIRSNCAFEYFYFADASSVIEGTSVNDVRFAIGKLLAKRCEHLMDRIDVVTLLPETPRPAASGFCKASGKTYADIIYKSKHVGRIFITPGQEAREQKAYQGFRYDKSAFAGKRIMIIDDSIVRGTNMKGSIKRIRELGAKEVHVGVTWPAITFPCPYGIDMPNLLVAQGRTNHEIAEFLGADSVTYVHEEDIYEVLGRKDVCMGCVTGKYPTDERKLT